MRPRGAFTAIRVSYAIPPTPELNGVAMSVSTTDRRALLRVAFKLLALGGLAGVISVFASALLSGGDPGPKQVRVTLSDLPAGETRVVEEGTERVRIVHRTPAMLEALGDERVPLADPRSRASRQPQGLDPTTRAQRPAYFIAFDRGTDLNCPLRFVAATADRPAGFIDRCRGSRYDAAGRVWKDQRATRNLAIPAYRFVDATTVIVELP